MAQSQVKSLQELLEELDAYILAPDRSGYGESSITVGRNLEVNANDMAEFLDAMNVDKVFLVGASGGGPHAFAFAAKYPGRVRGILALSPACKAGFFHADRIQGSGNPPDPKLLAAYRFFEGRPWLTRWLQRLSETYAVGRAIHSQYFENFSKRAIAGFTEADRRCAVVSMKGTYLLKVVPGALQQGVGTPVIQDLVSIMMPGSSANFSSIPQDIQKATHLWHSDYDPQVNTICLEEYKTLLPAAKSKIVQGGGHFAYWSCRKELQREALQGLVSGGL